MKRLVLIRHALPDRIHHTGEDSARALIPEGITQSLNIGKRLAHMNITPDFIGCSTAVRTRQTLEGILKTIPLPPHVFEDDLYLPQGETLETFIAMQIPESSKTAMIISHFPGVFEFAYSYGQKNTNLMGDGFHEASIAIFETTEMSWSNITPQNLHLIDFISGQDL